MSHITSHFILWLLQHHVQFSLMLHIVTITLVCLSHAAKVKIDGLICTNPLYVAQKHFLAFEFVIIVNVRASRKENVNPTE